MASGDDPIDLTDEDWEPVYGTDFYQGHDLPELTDTPNNAQTRPTTNHSTVSSGTGTGSISSSAYSSLPDSASSTSSTLGNIAKKRRKEVDPDAVARKLEEKERRQKEREEQAREKNEHKVALARIRDEKKKVKEFEKAQKDAARNVVKSKKPGECLKYMTVILEQSLIQTPIGAHLLPLLQSGEVQYRLVQGAVPGLVSWHRDNPADSQNSGMEVEEKEEEDDVLVLLPVDEFVNYVYVSNQASSDEVSLLSYVQQLKDNLPGKRLTIGVQGMEKYFRDIKTLTQRAYRQDVQAASSVVTEPKKGAKKIQVGTVVTRVELEQALVELEIMNPCNIKLLETPEELAKLIYQMTKAVAEAPYKRKRNDVDFTFMPDGKNIVKVQKDGTGLIKLWTHQFLQFNNVSPDIACAIVADYPAPLLLMQKYSECTSQKQAENLLADIKVRRGAGVLETSRRIGKELSRRIYQLMTSEDPSLVLK